MNGQVEVGRKVTENKKEASYKIIKTGTKLRLRASLFPSVPPYHVFLVPWESYAESISSCLQEEEWQFPAQIMPVVRDVVEHAGFKVVKGILRSDDETDLVMAGFIWDNLPLVEKAIDAINFKRLKAGVKINKFPGFSDLNRKDSLWNNFYKMQQKFGRELFGFHPDTFKLPAERKQLVERMKSENFQKVYIVKLPNNYCGIGACVIDHPKKIPRKVKEHQENNKKVTKEDSIIVQKYLQNPYLINGYKFDFRIYVLVTSVEPLRVYLYNNGLVRFATDKFSLSPEDLSNTFIHLTNFGLNKHGIAPDDYPPGTQMNKWTIYELWDWMREKGTDPEPFWESVKDVIIKTILCAHESIVNKVQESVESSYNNFNLLGFDIFMDSDMKPYLLEVNTIPSLFINNISKEVDTNIKAPLIAESLNICGHHISTTIAARHKAEILDNYFPDFEGKCLGYDHRLYCKKLSPEEESKQSKFVAEFMKNKDEFEMTGIEDNSSSEGNESEIIPNNDLESDLSVEDEESSEYEYFSDSANTDDDNVPEDSDDSDPSNDDILTNLTPSDVRVLVHSEEELTQVETYERIFPRANTSISYLDFMSRPSYYDLLLASWESRYSGNRREEGRGRLRDLTSKGVHLVVPESEKKIRIQHRSPTEHMKKSNYTVPHIFRNKK